MWADEARLDAAQRRIDDWESSLATRATRTRELSARLGTLRATARSEDRLVAATVDSSGALVDLRLDERVRAQPAARTAQQVLATTRAACAELLRQTTEATRELLEPDDPAANAVIDSYRRRLGLPEEGGERAER